jgi:ABC-2 type transport system permease protein
MDPLFTLAKPRWWSFRNGRLEQRRGAKLLLFGGIGVLFWVGIYAVSFRVLSYFQNVEGFGDILAHKLLTMVILTFFSLLIFSSILTSLSKLYLSKDLLLVHAMPIGRDRIFLSRWMESTVDSSWMVILYTLPILLAYGWIYKSGPLYIAVIALALPPLCLVASGLSALAVLLAVTALPATRIRSIFVFLGLGVLIVLYITFRMLRPERLVNPEAFASAMLYLQSLSTPSSPFLPSTWTVDSLKAALAGQMGTAVMHAAISWSAAGVVILMLSEMASIFYFRGFSKSQAASVRLFQGSSSRGAWLAGLLPRSIRAFVVKEIKTFWRDQTQWTQIFLIGALIVIYVYNFSVLPLDQAPIKTVYLQNLFSFLNMALAAFVLTAVAARFTFPSVSAEGAAFWIVRSAPISINAFLWIKFFIYLVPLMVLSQVLIVSTNLMLQVTPFMMALSVATIACLTPGVVAMGIGLGAAYPDFGSENPTQAVTSFGGLLFMILSAAYIAVVCILEAGPVYRIFMAQLRQRPLDNWTVAWTLVSFAIVLLLSVLAVLGPMRFGARRLSLRSDTGPSVRFNTPLTSGAGTGNNRAAGRDRPDSQ